MLKVHYDHFAWAIPAQGKSIPHSSTDQERVTVFLKSQSVPSIRERTGIQLSFTLVKDELATM